VLSAALFLSAVALLLPGCVGREGICEKVCDKALKCDEEDEAFERASDCKTECEEMTELTEDSCTQEFRRLSKCYKRRFDCDGSHGDACRRRRDQLSACLNAQEN